MKQEIDVKDYTIFVLEKLSIDYDESTIDELMFKYGCINDEEEE